MEKTILELCEVWEQNGVTVLWQDGEPTLIEYGRIDPRRTAEFTKDTPICIAKDAPFLTEYRALLGMDETQQLFASLGMTHTGKGVPAPSFLADGTRVAGRDAKKEKGMTVTTAGDLTLLFRAIECGWGLSRKGREHLHRTLFEPLEGLYVTGSDVLGYSVQYYREKQGAFALLHVTNMPQNMAQIEGQWLYYRRELREECCALLPKRTTRLVPYGEKNWRQTVRLRVKEEQTPFLLDPRECICRAAALGSKEKCFLLMQDEIAVGLVTLLLSSDELEEGEGEIDAFLIDRRFQGRGFGGEMLEKAVAWFAKHGYARVFVGLSRENEDAERFYASHGFKLYGYPEDGGLLMLREIG